MLANLAHGISFGRAHLVLLVVGAPSLAAARCGNSLRVSRSTEVAQQPGPVRLIMIHAFLPTSMLLTLTRAAEAGLAMRSVALTPSPLPGTVARTAFHGINTAAELGAPH